VDQTPGTNPTDAPADEGPPAPDDGQQAESPPEQSGFRSRGRARRRARFLRRARELAYRDLGGLVYNLHRFGQRNDPLVLAKLNTLSLIDGELRTIETTLAERRPITVLREAGITACPRCAAIHGSEDRYCPNCGLPMGRHADLPIAGAPAGTPAPADGVPPGGQTGVRPAQPAPAPAPVPVQPPSPPAQQPPPAARPVPANPATRRHPIASPDPSAPGRSPAPPPRGEPGTAVGAGSPSRPEEATEIIRPSGDSS
jgi:hypothetical protein